MKKIYIIFFISALIISCGDENSTNQNYSEIPVYTHSDIYLTGPGLQEYHDTISLNISGTDSIYTEFWTESTIDTLDICTVSINIFDTLNTNVYSNGYFTENPELLNNVHGFGFKMINETMKLQIFLVKGSIENRYLRIRNLKIFKK